jgi:hypothetical protein
LIYDHTPEGNEARKRIHVQLTDSLKQEWYSHGVALGYRYEQSPIIIPDGTSQPPMDISNYAQTARPGHRAPHAWLPDGRSTLDLFGQGFVLLSFEANASEAAKLGEAAVGKKVPLQIVEIDSPAIAALYERKLVLVRPDGHCAWRDDSFPGDVGELIDKTRGAISALEKAPTGEAKLREMT